MTVLGRVRVERAYYLCAHCHAGNCPRDTALGLTAGDLSRGATEAVALAGAPGSFAEAAQKILPTGRTFGETGAWKWSTDADGQTVAYVSADATGVGMQGPSGGPAEGRMASVGMVWNAGRPGQVRYVCGMTDGLAALSGPLRNQGAQVGMDRARRWVAISDGGAGLEGWLRDNFARVEDVILDFYHVAEHVNDWAKVLHRDDAAEARRVAAAWCHRLKHEGGAAVLEDLKRIDTSGRSEAVAEAHRVLLVYVGNQVHRMDYPRYRAKGWLIGSGPVKAACKQVVGQRLKGTGMRWGEPGADALCHLRALFRSEKGQWDGYWATLAA